MRFEFEFTTIVGVGCVRQAKRVFVIVAPFCLITVHIASRMQVATYCPKCEGEGFVYEPNEPQDSGMQWIVNRKKLVCDYCDGNKFFITDQN